MVLDPAGHAVAQRRRLVNQADCHAAAPRRRLRVPCDDTLRWMSLIAAAMRLKIPRAGRRIAASGDRRMVRRLVREAIQAEREDSSCVACGTLPVPFAFRAAQVSRHDEDGGPSLYVSPLCPACLPPAEGQAVPGYPGRVLVPDGRPRPVLDAMAHAVLPELEGLAYAPVADGLRPRPC